MNIHYRQGDVLLLKVDNLPAGATLDKLPEPHRIVLAYGEVTGHAHAMSPANTTLYVDGRGDRYIVATPGSQLVHEEHNPIILDPGVYKVVRQREYTPGDVRLVAD